MNKEQYLSLERELIELANSHKCEYSNKLRNKEGAPYFTFRECNIPLLYDVRVLLDKYELRYIIDHSATWGYIGIDFNNYYFETDEEFNDFVEMIKSL